MFLPFACPLTSESRAVPSALPASSRRAGLALSLLCGVLGTLLLPLAASAAQGTDREFDPEWVLRAERTQFRESASSAEVMDWLGQAAAIHPRLHLTGMGYSNEGRIIPLLVAGPVADSSPEAVRNASRTEGLPVIYLQANIHAGEVAGKEALLRLVRELALELRPGLLDDLILLIGPNYNPDGNDRIDLRNRPRQHGPVGGMGTRANAQGLDLNRDQMKLDAPEARSLARLMTDYDPHMVVDLHTTNGTRIAYHLTYAPGLHPATPSAIDALVRDDLLPTATEGVLERYGWHMWHYGNVFSRGGVEAWWTFDHRPRFVTNYVGIRNRLAVLSEAYSYATFEDRILATERFVDEILGWSRVNGDRIREVVEAEDRRDLRGERIPLRAGFPDEAQLHPILLGEVDEEFHPWTGEVMLRRRDVVRQQTMPAFVHFVGTEYETAPGAYLIPPHLTSVVERLRAHGIRMQQGWDGSLPGLEGFRIQERVVAERVFQGRNEVTLVGEWEPALPSDVPTVGTLEEEPSQWWVVPMDQPLARLAFLLLEPRSDDGLSAWGLLDPWLDDGYPILRVVAPGIRGATGGGPAGFPVDQPPG